MSVAVIGAGGVGRAIAGRLAGAGEEVTLGVRRPAVASADAAPDGVRLQPVASAVDAAQVVIVAIPGDQIPSFIRAHAAGLGGRTVIDATNDLGTGHAGPLHHVADWMRDAPDAAVFRAFNTMGWENFATPSFDGVAADLFYCGPAARLEAVEHVIRTVGLNPVRIGDIDTADVLDGLTRLWFTLAFAGGRGRRLAFRLLTDSAA